MSRFLGIVCDQSGHPAAGLPARAGESTLSARGWTRSHAAEGKAAFSWLGRGERRVARRDGVLVSVEGFFFAVDGKPNAGDEAGVLARLYLEAGLEEALRRVNGDFAVAVYDSRDGVLRIARDRFGVRPLYYAIGRGCFGFASQPSLLRGLPGVALRPRREYAALFAGCHYRYFDNRPDLSAYEDILQVPAGTVLAWDGRKTTARAWWALEEVEDLRDDEATLAARYRDLILDAVRIRIARAEKPAFTLSGGMDSSTILASTVKLTGRKPIAFSSVYEDKTYDESAEIASMLGHVEQWNQVKIGDPDVFGLVERMIAVHDEPVCTATWLSHFVLCEEVARQGYRSLFGGLGGDELNAGEYEHFFFNFADLMAAGRRPELEREVAKWVEYHDHPIFRKDMAVAEATVRRSADLSIRGKCLPDRVRLERYAAALDPACFDLRAWEPAMDHPFTSYLDNRLFQDIYRETIPPCLRAEDRQTTAFGIENFVPFYDHRLAELMFAVPGRMKIRDGVTKHLLRGAMEGILPEETRTRVKKVGWNAPAHKWFNGPGLERLKGMVADKAFRERGIYDLKEVDRLMREHEDIVTGGKNLDNHMMFFWQLVNLETWLRGLPAGA